jgi:hypothetical protein
VSFKEHSTVIASEDISEVTSSAASSFRMSGSGGDTIVEIPLLCRQVEEKERDLHGPV